MLGSMYLYFTIFLKLKTWQYPNCGWKIESQAWSSISVQLSTGFKSLYNFNSIKSDLGEDNFVIRSVWLIFGLWSKRRSPYALDSWVTQLIWKWKLFIKLQLVSEKLQCIWKTEAMIIKLARFHTYAGSSSSFFDEKNVSLPKVNLQCALMKAFWKFFEDG